MKSFLSFFGIAVISGIACFAILYWIIKMDIGNAFTASVSVAIGGFVVDYLMKYTNSRKKKST